jgi:hypothetical protein
MSADTSEAPQAVLFALTQCVIKCLFQGFVCCQTACFPSTRFEQLGVNFKAPKAARLLHARRLCDLRTTRFATIFTLVQFSVFDLLGT